MNKLTCHCGKIEAEVKVPEGGFEKIMRCNCSICKRKGYIIGVVGPDDFKIIKGVDNLSSYKFNTMIAEHFFCKTCGIYTHHNRRTDPNGSGINIGCIDEIDPFKYEAGFVDMKNK